MKASRQVSAFLSARTSCRDGVGKRRRPRPINRHASTEATGGWGPRHAALALWLRPEAKFERALGPGATVGVLGTGVPRLACLRPTAWLCWWAHTAHLHQQAFKTLARAKPREADDTRPPQERPHRVASRGAERSRQGKPHEVLVK